MPIKNASFGDEAPTASQPATADGTTAPKKRRTKKELIAAAVIPADDIKVAIKFKATGTEGDREWPIAVGLVKEGKAEFVDKGLKYAVLKMDQNAEGGGAGAGGSAPAANRKVGEKLDSLETRWVALQAKVDEAKGEQEIRDLSAEAENVREEITSLGGQDPTIDEAYARREKGEPQSLRFPKDGPRHVPLPDAAEIGDEVVINGSTSYIGHGHTMISASPHNDAGVIEANGRWAKTDNGWNYTDLKKERTAARASEEGFHDPAAGDKLEDGNRSITKAASQAAGITKDGEKNTQGDLVIQREAVGQGAELVDVNLGLWKVSMGYLEKIGLPDYSSLQIGPASAQRHILDDGRRIVVAMHGREVEIPAVVAEAMQEAAQVCEYVMRAERQAMVNFLEAVKPGSTKPS